MNHFKADLVVSSNVVDFKVLSTAIKCEYFFFLIKTQNGECNIRNFKQFLLGISPDIPAFKLRVFTSDFLNFELEQTNVSSIDILTQILLTLLIFIALPILRKISNYRGWFLFGVSYRVNFQFTH